MIADFAELPAIISKPAKVMGIDSGAPSSPAITSTRAFTRDVLRVEIERPHRLQLSVVDVPGIVQTETKGVSKHDKAMVAKITDFYNPLIIGELFWESSSKWETLAEDHVEQVAGLCKMFTNTLLKEICPKDVHAQISALKVSDTLHSCKLAATAEPER